MSEDKPFREGATSLPASEAAWRRAHLAEVQNRIRNVLAVVRSIARRTAETSETIEDYSSTFEGRINAYARTLTLLELGDEAGVDLEYLVADELLTVQARDGEELNISGPEMRLRPKAAETVGLAIHELTTNALRHGALGHPKGRVDVSWKVEGDTLVFDWRESSSRRLMPQPTRRGFGVILLEETLPFDLGAITELRFASPGFSCTIRLPLTDKNFILLSNH